MCISTASISIMNVPDESAVKIWNDFQYFAAHHSSIPAGNARKLCQSFESSNLRNFSLIDTKKKLRQPTANGKTMNKRPIRILFLTTKRSLFLLNDRWYFELYKAIASQPNVHIVMWGVGMPGFRNEDTTRDNILNWFVDPVFDIVHSTWYVCPRITLIPSLNMTLIYISLSTLTPLSFL